MAKKESFLYTYSKALRCTFFGEWKNSCSSKFVELLLLNRVKARWSKNRAAQGFYYINSFSSNIFGPNSKTCTCKVRAAWGRVSRGLTVNGIFKISGFHWSKWAIACLIWRTFIFWIFSLQPPRLLTNLKNESSPNKAIYSSFRSVEATDFENAI